MELSKIQQLDKYLQNYLRSMLEGKVEEQFVKELSKSLFPIPSEDTFADLYKAISTFYLIKINKNVPLDEITKDFNAKCQEIGHGLPEALSIIAEGEFAEKFKAKFSNAKDAKTIQVMLNSSSSSGPREKEEKKMNDVVVVGSSKPKDFPKQPTQTGSNKSNSKHQQIRPANNSQVDYVNNLADRGICLCQKQVTSQQSAFQCIHCGRNYHLQCMKKKAGTRHCSMCHLKRMLPNKEVKKVLFMGVLKKSKKKHQFSIYLSDQDLSMKYKLQIRSIRLKEPIQYFILFPDYANIVLNNSSVKEFQPLHRQSSLKYRKDEPFYAQLKHLLPKDNKVVIHQKLPSKESKQHRIDAENHLIGFFMVEDRKIDPLVKEIAASSVTLFEQSRKILQSAFRTGNSADDVTCEVVKIPLLCTLSTERIRLPARGLFCNHYQCFDLYNFMIVTSSSSNPKWICPLCKLPSYEFRVDSILQAIISLCTDEKGTEVMFFKGGDFTVHAGDRVIDLKIKSIAELPIDNIGKRIIEPPTEPQRRRKKPFILPETQNVISLD